MARTFYHRPAGGKVVSLQGHYYDYTNLALTNDATTTAEIDKRGYSHGCVENDTGSAITITWYGCMTPGGTAHALYDEDGSALTSTITADNQIGALPSAVAGVPFLVPVSNGATDTVSIHLER
jgi:hypothetical protein